MNTLETLNDIFRKVFGDNSLIITAETTADDVDNWDSLTHMILITSVEAKFTIRFSGKDLLIQRNVGDLVKDIDRLLAV